MNGSFIKQYGEDSAQKNIFLHMYAYLMNKDKKILRVKKEGRGAGPTPYFFPGPTAAVDGPGTRYVVKTRLGVRNGRPTRSRKRERDEER